MKNHTLFLVFCVLFVMTPQTSYTCTSFCLDQASHHVLGKSFDSYVSNALLVVNKRSVLKTSLETHEETDIGKPAVWTSKYGSITFNVMGPELPSGGINEVGLVVEALWLPGTEYPASDSRPYIKALQWIQYQLDNFRTVEEMIASDSQLRIKTDEGTKIHFLVSDKIGNGAVIEFIGGNLIYYTNEMMFVKILTNSIYAESIAFLKEHTGWGGDLPIPQGERTLDRFVRAAEMVRNYDPETSESVIDYAFDILANVSQTEITITQWSKVYDIKNLRIYFCTFKNKKVLYIDLSSFDFSCTTPVKVLDVTANLSGDVSNDFSDYTYEINLELFKKNAEYINFTGEVLDIITHYPETTNCTEISSSSTSSIQADSSTTTTISVPTSCPIEKIYGEHSEETELLRYVRDNVLIQTPEGQNIIRLYYEWSPVIVKAMEEDEKFEEEVNEIIDGILLLIGEETE